mmetsp:Transcript_12299/g.18423  ORF Transcript_12299/g.18423 Transcript_12299/m.18423 type:complete len:246 (+) Transcript_12299:2-739(+)
MPPKKATKPDKKKAAKQIEDKTFGLKNKSKSKTVQKYVKTVEQSVKSSQGMVKSEQDKQKKKASKEAAKKAEMELKALFNEGLMEAKKGPAKVGNTTQNNAPPPPEKKEKKAQTTFEIADSERTIEDMIEAQREKFRAEGKVGTKVTEESLALWKKRRLETKKKMEKELYEKEVQKKGKKKAMSSLSGRALFDQDQSLFKDDANAYGDKNEEFEDQSDGRAVDNLTQGIDENLFLGQGDDLDDLK